MRLPSATLCAGILIIASADVSAQVQDVSLQVQPEQKVRKDRNRITAEELRANDGRNLYEVVQATRPQWLRVRGSRTFRTRERVEDPTGLRSVVPDAEIVVYVDGIRHGSQMTLRSLSAHDIIVVEFLDATSATQRWGTGHEYGAIIVTRKQ